jgi:hypothetical protein
MQAPPAAEGMLTTEEYHLLAAVPLQAAAEIAAQRGDPHLFNDMPAMLALLAMVTTLTHAYLEGGQVFLRRSPASPLEAAPVAVCALVFSESNLEASEVETCLRALSTAYFQLLQEGVLGPQDAYVDKAFEALLAGDRVTALQFLKRATSAMASAIDAWEAGQAVGAS